MTAIGKRIAKSGFQVWTIASTTGVEPSVETFTTRTNVRLGIRSGGMFPASSALQRSKPRTTSSGSRLFLRMMYGMLARWSLIVVSPSIAANVDSSTPGIFSINRFATNSAPLKCANCFCASRWSQIAAVLPSDRNLDSRSIGVRKTPSPSLMMTGHRPASSAIPAVVSACPRTSSMTATRLVPLIVVMIFCAVGL